MSKRFDERLAAVRRAVADPDAREARGVLTKALNGSNGLLVAVATQAITPERDGPTQEPLVKRLEPAFARMLGDAIKRDPQCQAKTAIARCLRELEADGDEVFLAGVRHVQMEPVWGGRVDTAAELRGICAMALAERRHPRAMVEAAHLLADGLVAARTAAARAIGCSGDAAAGEPLLRLRVEVGEQEPDVVGECFGALLELAPASALEFVAAHLSHKDDVMVEAAALAMGGSRLDAAFEPLRDAAERVVLGPQRGVLLLGVAMLRSDRAWSYLLEQIEDGPRGVAEAALRGLSTFAYDDRLVQRVRAAVSSRPDDVLGSLVDELFDPEADEG